MTHHMTLDEDLTFSQYPVASQRWIFLVNKKTKESFLLNMSNTMLIQYLNKISYNPY